MEATSGAIEKICVICNENCSARPRVKDRHGRYYCKACHDAAKNESATTNDDESIEGRPPIAMDGASAAFDDLESITLRPCESCQYPLAPDVVVCLRCGWHRERGEQLDVRVGREEAPAPAETGQAAKHDEWRRKTERDVRRRAYTTPLLMLAVGGGITLATQVTLHGDAAAADYLISFGASLVVGVLAFLLCSVLWVGFDAPLHLTTIWLAGIYAVTDAVALIPGIGWLLAIATYIGLLSEMLDLDLTDAVLVALITFIVKTAVVFALVSMIGI